MNKSQINSLSSRCRKYALGGFSLIEVNMALLVVGIGLVALLGLFPVGLREASLATADTTEALFASHILNAIQANAGEITTLDEWNKDAPFIRNIDVSGAQIKVGGTQKIENAYGISKNTIRYQLRLGEINDRVRYAAIRVANDKYSYIDDNVVYYTEFRYLTN